MAQQTIYTCDVCGTQKREANHWFRLRVGTCRERDKVAAAIVVQTILISTWESIAPLEADQHICGQECLGRRVSELIAPAAPAKSTGGAA